MKRIKYGIFAASVAFYATPGLYSIDVLAQDVDLSQGVELLRNPPRRGNLSPPPRRPNGNPEYRVPDRQIQHFIITRRSPWPIPSESDPPFELNRYGRALSLGIIGDQVFLEGDMRIDSVSRVMARNFVMQRLGAIIRVPEGRSGADIITQKFKTADLDFVMQQFDSDLAVIGDERLRTKVREEISYLLGRVHASKSGAFLTVAVEVGRKWPTFPISYDSSAMGDTKKKEIDDATKHWREKTGLTFKNVSGSASGDHIKFIPGSGCSSHVGYQQEQPQEIVLADSCTFGTVIHEIGHAVGLHHEQAHPERDSFVTIIWNKIRSGAENNFLKAGNAGVATAYDYGSIMHYETDAFSVDGSPTIVPKQQFTGEIGQRDGLSPRDIEGVKALYPECQPKGCAE